MLQGPRKKTVPPSTTYLGLFELLYMYTIWDSLLVREYEHLQWVTEITMAIKGGSSFPDKYVQEAVCQIVWAFFCDPRHVFSPPILITPQLYLNYILLPP